jgi:hypothetical protein
MVNDIDTSSAMLINSVISDRKDSNVISLLYVRSGDVELWKSNEEARLKREGIPVIEERSFRFDDEGVRCVSSYALYERTHAPELKDTAVVHCGSTGGLEIEFQGQQDLQLFYSLIPKIRKTH